MTDHIFFDRIGIIGTGRVAQAFALAIAPLSRTPLLLHGRSRERLDAALACLPGTQAAPDLQSLAAQCDLILLAVSDDAIAAMAQALADAAPCLSNAFVIHLSGASGTAILAPVADKGALTAAIHPAMTFIGQPETEARRLAATPFAVTGATPAATEKGIRLVAAIGGTPFPIAEEQRTLYHTALCHSSNHLVTLLAGSARMLEAAGVAAPYPLLAPLVRAALDNSLANGFGALSGPLLRGDIATIARHLDALATEQPDMLPDYRAMAMATLRELERPGPAGQRDVTALRRLLEE